jgi:predicted N-formylglutamate amidohydrolase
MKYYKQIKELKTPLVFTCEHASDFIPPEYSNLGLTSKYLRQAKDLFDLGSLKLAQGLAQNLNASMLYTEFSRLLIDANRFLGVKTNHDNTYHAAALKTELLIEDKKGERLVPIPGNRVANYNKEEKYRWNKYVKPYYQEIKRLTEQLADKFDRVYIFQIHSFYPKYKGDIRKVDIGVIHNKLPLAKKIIHQLRSITELRIGDNEPWGMRAVSGGLLEPLRKQGKVFIVGIDINNKHLRQQQAISKIQGILTTAIKNTIF